MRKINLEATVPHLNSWWPSTRWGSCLLAAWLVFGFLTTPRFVTGVFGLPINYAIVIALRYFIFIRRKKAAPTLTELPAERTIRIYAHDCAIVVAIVGLLLAYDAVSTKGDIVSNASQAVEIMSGIEKAAEEMNSWSYIISSGVEGFLRGLVWDIKGVLDKSDAEQARYSGYVDQYNELQAYLQEAAGSYDAAQYQLVWSIIVTLMAVVCIVLMHTKYKQLPTMA